MTTIRQLRHEFTSERPSELESGVIYIFVDCSPIALHLCCCGCGLEVATPFAPNEWMLIFDGKTISLNPSIGCRQFPCRSHYWIERNQVKWLPAFPLLEEEPSVLARVKSWLSNVLDIRVAFRAPPVFRAVRAQPFEAVVFFLSLTLAVFVGFSDFSQGKKAALSALLAATVLFASTDHREKPLMGVMLRMAAVSLTFGAAWHWVLSATPSHFLELLILFVAAAVGGVALWRYLGIFRQGR